MMGITKFERWTEFYRAAVVDPLCVGDASPVVVGQALAQMAVEMEKQPPYFDPELPETFRFLAEAIKEPRGAAKTLVYGAVRSAENLISFLGRKALGIVGNIVNAAERHISTDVADSLIWFLSGAALTLFRALPAGWRDSSHCQALWREESPGKRT
ncbi:MAG TPA: hypothetical protein VGG99_03980 [Acetobacteraceae bacterium]|jgi:hypothetical protein